MATGTQTQAKVRIIENPSNWEEPLPANHGRWFSNISHVSLVLCRLSIKNCLSPSLEIYLIFLSDSLCNILVPNHNGAIVFKMRRQVFQCSDHFVDILASMFTFCLELG